MHNILIKNNLLDRDILPESIVHLSEKIKFIHKKTLVLKLLENSFIDEFKMINGLNFETDDSWIFHYKNKTIIDSLSCRIFNCWLDNSNLKCKICFESTVHNGNTLFELTEENFHTIYTQNIIIKNNFYKSENLQFHSTLIIFF